MKRIWKQQTLQKINDEKSVYETQTRKPAQENGREQPVLSVEVFR